MDATQGRKANDTNKPSGPGAGTARKGGKLAYLVRDFFFGDGRRVRRAMLFTVPTILVATIFAVTGHYLADVLGFEYSLTVVAVVCIIVTALTATPLIAYCVDI